MVVFSLTLVRHGETTANQAGVIQGHQDVALSEVGEQQAQLVALRLQSDIFTHIYSSDLSRAAQTAQAIAQASHSTCSVQLDKRLRERRFGTFEGRTFTELFEEAKRHNKQWTDYVPDGAETYLDVRTRAQAFFQDLCKEMARMGSPVDNPVFPPTFGLSNGTTQSEAITQDGKPAGHKTVTAATTTVSVSVSVSASPQDCMNSVTSVARPVSIGDFVSSSKRPRTEDAEFHRLSLDGDDGDRDCVFTDDVQPVSTMPRSNSSSSSGCSSLHDSLEADLSSVDTDHSPTVDRSAGGSPYASRAGHAVTLFTSFTSCCSDGANRTSVRGKDGSLSVAVGGTGRAVTNSGSVGSVVGQARRHVDSQVRWHADVSQPRDVDRAGGRVGGASTSYPQACPNVSLSPMLEHRGITSVSSVSSGRNSSFDDADIIPAVAADVLVVSHGGLIKMLLTHFIEDFQCKVPGGKGHALRTCPNTGVSRFMVTLPDRCSVNCVGSEGWPTVTCLLMNDKDHLRSMPPLSAPSPKTGAGHSAVEMPAV